LRAEVRRQTAGPPLARRRLCPRPLPPRYPVETSRRGSGLVGIRLRLAEGAARGNHLLKRGVIFERPAQRVEPMRRRRQGGETALDLLECRFHRQQACFELGLCHLRSALSWSPPPFCPPGRA